jgi:hypothetical protein
MYLCEEKWLSPFSLVPSTAVSNIDQPIQNLISLFWQLLICSVDLTVDRCPNAAPQ